MVSMNIAARNHCSRPMARHLHGHNVCAEISPKALPRLNFQVKHSGKFGLAHGGCGGTRRSTSSTSSPAPRNVCWTPTASPHKSMTMTRFAQTPRFFKVYEKALQAAGAIDFADMVPLLVRAMDNNSAYAASITGAYVHVLVDEYQD